MFVQCSLTCSFRIALCCRHVILYTCWSANSTASELLTTLWPTEMCVYVIITARCELRKVVFLAPSCSLWVFFVCVWNISGTAERICAKFTGKTCLVPRSVGRVWRSRSKVQNSLCVEVLHSPTLAALLHGTRVVGVSKTAALSRGRHLYSAGRPSRWALAHILVVIIIF